MDCAWLCYRPGPTSTLPTMRTVGMPWTWRIPHCKQCCEKPVVCVPIWEQAQLLAVWKRFQSDPDKRAFPAKRFLKVGETGRLASVVAEQSWRKRRRRPAWCEELTTMSLRTPADSQSPSPPCPADSQSRRPAGSVLFRCQRERCTATANCLEWFSSFQFIRTMSV